MPALAALEPALLDAFEALLSENDHDLYRWIAGASEVPNALRGDRRPDPRASRHRLSALAGRGALTTCI